MKTITLKSIRKRSPVEHSVKDVGDIGKSLRKRKLKIVVNKAKREDSERPPSGGIAERFCQDAKKHANANKNRHDARQRFSIDSTNKHKLALRELEKHFPKLFNLSNPKPLAIGIREQMLAIADLPVSKKKVRLGLYFYCNSHQYLSCICEGKKRYNAANKSDGRVTKEQQEIAIKQIKQLFSKIRNSQKKK